MSRFPQRESEELTNSQKRIGENVHEMLGRFPQLDYQDSEGNFLGPFQSLIYTPEIIDPFFELGFAVTRQTRFTPKERELIVLAVLAEYDAPYPLYIHSEIALKCGLSELQVQQAVNGTTPDGLGVVEATIYEFALKLTRLRGPLPATDFEHARKKLPEHRIAGLAHVVCGYTQVCLLSNIGDNYVPPAKEGVFRATKNSKTS
ncbi:MAG: hypothetical protein M1820_000748 [Bogoriella megaspora]|nr:MAG: hypothetical protein M1820_000748 [Bogoriella megaspora]